MLKTEAPDFESYANCRQLPEMENFMSEHGFSEFSRHKFASRPQSGGYFDNFLPEHAKTSSIIRRLSFPPLAPLNHSSSNISHYPGGSPLLDEKAIASDAPNKQLHYHEYLIHCCKQV